MPQLNTKQKLINESNCVFLKPENTSLTRYETFSDHVRVISNEFQPPVYPPPHQGIRFIASIILCIIHDTQFKVLGDIHISCIVQ